jgi:MinD superfamily P-loop ATPase
MIGSNYRVPRVDAEKCRACRRCLARQACRVKALIQFEAHELPYVDQELCRGCLVCMQECPFRAIEAG